LTVYLFLIDDIAQFLGKTGTNMAQSAKTPEINQT
jgi:hypothetical protein